MHRERESCPYLERTDLERFSVNHDGFEEVSVDFSLSLEPVCNDESSVETHGKVAGIIVIAVVVDTDIGQQLQAKLQERPFCG